MSSLQDRKAKLEFDKKIIEIRELIVEAQEIKERNGIYESVINELFENYEIEKACRNCS